MAEHIGLQTLLVVTVTLVVVYLAVRARQDRQQLSPIERQYALFSSYLSTIAPAREKSVVVTPRDDVDDDVEVEVVPLAEWNCLSSGRTPLVHSVQCRHRCR